MLSRRRRRHSLSAFPVVLGARRRVRRTSRKGKLVCLRFKRTSGGKRCAKFGPRSAKRARRR